MTLPELCERDIRSLHQFFVDWRAGRLARTPEVYDRFARVMDEKFIIVAPDGKLTERAALMERLEAGHNSNDQFEIGIRNFITRHQWDDYCLVTYEEWQNDRGVASARLSSALLRAAPELDEGVQWLAVHETWLPGKAPK